jgi:type IV secretory pathway protease TraF
MIASSGVGLLVFGLSAKQPPLLIYNATSSVPTGFYRIRYGRPLRRGALMAVELPPAWRTWAAERGYLPADVPALKRIAAGAGDHVCRRGTDILLNGHSVARALPRDGAGRSMPQWVRCVRLAPGEWFVLNPAAASFDSRYIGPLSTRAFHGEAVAR